MIASHHFCSSGKLTARLYVSHTAFFEGVCWACSIGILAQFWNWQRSRIEGHHDSGSDLVRDSVPSSIRRAASHPAITKPQQTLRLNTFSADLKTSEPVTTANPSVQ